MPNPTNAEHHTLVVRGGENSSEGPLGESVKLCSPERTNSKNSNKV